MCADDYALTPGVSRSIRELLAAGRISATSVMAASEFWPSEAAALRAVAGDANIGLHVTLTDHVPLGLLPTFAPTGRFPAMAVVHKAGLLRRLPRDEIAAEIERQLQAFITHWGAPPAHIDGHHHVHQLPGVRDLVIDVAARFGGRTWLRVCQDRPRLILRRGVATAKSFALAALGPATNRRARKSHVPTNDGFSGAYDFLSEARPFADLAPRFLVGARENTLLMCHPGHSDATLADLDVMTTARDREHAYFMSDAWPMELARAGLDLGPYRAM